MKFCQDHRIEYQHRQVQAVWPNGKYEDYRLHCFADAEAATMFRVSVRGSKTTSANIPASASAHHSALHGRNRNPIGFAVSIAPTGNSSYRSSRV